MTNPVFVLSSTVFFGGFGVMVAQLINWGVRNRADGWCAPTATARSLTQ